MKVKDEENVPEIVKNKLQNYKVEAKLTNNKDIKGGSQITACPRNINVKKLLKISIETISYSELENEICISRKGRLISDIYKVSIFNGKGIEAEPKDYAITYTVKCPNLDKYCYPMVCNVDGWRSLEQYEIEEDLIKISENNWKLLTIVKEPPFEIINVSKNGGLLYSKLDPFMCLRISKGVFKEEVKCKIQFCDMPLQHLNDLRHIYDDQLSPYVNISQMTCLDIIESTNDVQSSPFRRPISIKLRLPDWVIALLNEQKFDSKNIVRDQKTEKIGFYLLQKTNDEWNFVESSLKFTSNFVEFDVKFFGSFVFVNCRDNREFRLCPNLTLVENLMRSETGVILSFLWIKTKDWFIWFEIVPIHKIKETRSKLESKGFIFIEQSYEAIKPDQGKKTQYHRKSSRAEATLFRKTIELTENIQFKLSINGELEIISNTDDQSNEELSNIPNGDEPEIKSDKFQFDGFDKIGIKVKKEVSVEEEVVEKIKPDLSYHQNTLHSNCAVVRVAPVTRDIDTWESTVLKKLEKRSLYQNSIQCIQNGILSQSPIVAENGNIQKDIDNQLIEPTSEDSKKISRLNKDERDFNFLVEINIEPLNPVPNIYIPKQIYKFYIPLDSIKDYFQIKTKAEKERLEEEFAMIRVETERKKELEEKLAAEKSLLDNDDKPKKVDINHIRGMAKPRYAYKIIDKEPKVISRRSFLALSTVVRQGLKLAVYLSIPDNVIAGIGFDALSQMSINGTNNTTYKVLLLWKKMILLNKTSEKEYIDQLIFSLNAIGYERIGQLVHNQWLKQQEITAADCQKCLLQNNY